MSERTRFTDIRIENHFDIVITLEDGRRFKLFGIPLDLILVGQLAVKIKKTGDVDLGYWVEIAPKKWSQAWQKKHAKALSYACPMVAGVE